MTKTRKDTERHAETRKDTLYPGLWSVWMRKGHKNAMKMPQKDTERHGKTRKDTLRHAEIRTYVADIVKNDPITVHRGRYLGSLIYI